MDRYLISDLTTMIEEVKPRKCGGLGYPAIHSIITGIELLGLLMSNKRQENAFHFFWENYFKKENSIYEGANEMIYMAVRQGTAHIFLVKAGISVSKSGRNHFEQSEINGKKYLNIDLKCFFRDFKSCYERIKDLILRNQDERKLAQFDCGYEQLLSQIKGARPKVDEFLQSIQSKELDSDSSIKSDLTYSVSASHFSSDKQTATVFELSKKSERAKRKK